MSRLVAVLEHYGVEMKNPDKNRQLVLCPFGHESHPSCSIDLAKGEGLWNCFSCGRGGDALDLIQEQEGCDYAASVRKLAGIAGAGDGTVRAAYRGGRRAPGGTGYRPRYRRSLPPGSRP